MLIATVGNVCNLVAWRRAILMGTLIVAPVPLPALAVTADDVKCKGCVGKQDLAKKAIGKDEVAKNAAGTKHIKNKTLKEKDFDPSVFAAPANVIEVAKSGGDFTDPVAALDSITDSSADNRYLVRIGPGVFDIGSGSVQMKPYVDLVGAGADATEIRGNPEGANDLAVIMGADRSGVSDLRIQHTGGTTSAQGLVALLSTMDIRHVLVDISAAVAESAFGLSTTGGDSRMADVHVRLSGSANYRVGAELLFGGKMVDSTVSVTGPAMSGNLGLVTIGNVGIHGLTVDVSGGNENMGLESFAVGVRVSDARIVVSGGNDTVGIRGSGMTIIASDIEATGGANENVGIELEDGTFVTASRVTASGGATNWGLRTKDDADRVTNSLTNTAVDDGSIAQNCVDVFDISNVAVGVGC